ncbi:diacylglycerol kinase [Alicyclobacillus acidoterrestris]|uniref:Diacylglycerol kinase n=1 Tax=Alicyclobacillus acidoterrestris (strain ATCC 49025 / DSM 3922 / CIP 106132 / NCIMB 13137 / GD3B) TaxID=1356854 RepID=T0CJB7_ALIAG|nr:diacylglycerol kinase [Alicyclobacillus acidoterrestris]EPZ52595.1 hypothetical protein N007_20350 [Alicyclobacillus acidoterrestris ATCC 49025]UNO47895.1 diacylglycerol kinase [Alicyclobacillus acidoterrestris]GEO26835.1 hypothetical protein AAC03nite_26200 [Alicyclobacillus acidoterrestris]
MHYTSKFKTRSFRKSLQYAFHGIVYAFHQEANMRRHFWLFNALAAFELVLRPTLTVVVVSLFVAMCIFCAELFNTAIELVVDLAVGWRHHPIAGLAKDVAAGATSMLALGSLFVGVWIIVGTVPLRFRLLTAVHPLATAMLLVACVAMWVVRFWPVRPIEISYPEKKETQDGV